MSTLFPSSCHPRLISALPCRLLAGNETTRRCPAGSEAPLAGEGLAFIAWREAGLLPCPPPSSLLSYLVSLPVLSPLSRRSPSIPQSPAHVLTDRLSYHSLPPPNTRSPPRPAQTTHTIPGRLLFFLSEYSAQIHWGLMRISGSEGNDRRLLVAKFPFIFSYFFSL